MMLAQGPILVHYLLHHVAWGDLHGHCHGRRRAVGHHPDSGRTLYELHLVAHLEEDGFARVDVQEHHVRRDTRLVGGGRRRHVGGHHPGCRAVRGAPKTLGLLLLLQKALTAVAALLCPRETVHHVPAAGRFAHLPVCTRLDWGAPGCQQGLAAHGQERILRGPCSVVVLRLLRRWWLWLTVERGSVVCIGLGARHWRRLLLARCSRPWASACYGRHGVGLSLGPCSVVVLRLLRRWWLWLTVERGSVVCIGLGARHWRRLLLARCSRPWASACYGRHGVGLSVKPQPASYLWRTFIAGRHIEGPSETLPTSGSVGTCRKSRRNSVGPRSEYRGKPQDSGHSTQKCGGENITTGRLRYLLTCTLAGYETNL
uniref:Uncharacterized protein n=1 Tax=Ixodes ricinus TaxID=34613 RepID=A0A6B0V9X5_IXORI